MRGYLCVSILCLFVNFDAIARSAFFSENAYLSLGAGAFHNRSFKKSGEYLKKKLNMTPVFNVGVGYKFSQYLSSDINLQYCKIVYAVRGKWFSEWF